MYISEKSVDAAFSAKSCNCIAFRTGREPSLGGALREKAVWVDESDCIGCRYCAHVASNTFVMVPETGRCRACLLYTSPSPRDYAASRMPSSA